MAEISSLDYPGERLVVCKNPLLAEERRRKRDELLALTEADLKKIRARVTREKIRCVALVKSARLWAPSRANARWPSTSSRPSPTIRSTSRARKTPSPKKPVRWFYVLRTSLSTEQIDTAQTGRAYKSLAQVERAFRCMKTVDLDLRPVFHWAAPRVRAHGLLCMLAYYLEWQMRQPLAPMLFDDHDRTAAKAERTRQW